MIEYTNGLLAPFAPWLMKRSDQLPAFGIHTDNRQPLGGVIFNLGADVAKLSVALLRTWRVFYPRLKSSIQAALFFIEHAAK